MIAQKGKGGSKEGRKKKRKEGRKKKRKEERKKERRDVDANKTRKYHKY